MATLTLKLQALWDLLRRYGEIFSHVWKDRQKLDSPVRLSHEAQFLPAALELQETPVSPAPRVTMWILIGFALIALLWTIFGHIDVVATGHGKIVPNDRSKVIQSFDTSTVKAIHVTDGQAVKAGDVLIELDGTSQRADHDRVSSDLAEARLQAARAKAMLAAIGSGRVSQLAAPGVPKDRLVQEQRHLEGQFGEFQSKVARLEADISRREAELRSTQEVVRKLEQTAPIARQRADDYRNLVEKNFVSKHGYLEKEQSRIELEADLATQHSRVEELKAALRTGQSERLALIAEARRIALDSLNEGEQKATELAQEQVKAENRKNLMQLTAPVDGTVQQLAVHTVGGVVTEAQQLMVVVPRDDSVEVEAFLENKDVGFVFPDQEAEIKIETFPYTKYGTVHGKVIHVSQDAINDEKKGLIYSTRVKLDRATMRVDGRQVNLAPGMAVSVEIKTSKRRVIEYFLSPLIQYKDESFRER
ncbi:HlyD family type I secretion periplasmic adaptor subunit [Denitratisoma sp. DHT3]|uniref:HlyD family type I secretion periplasmic adaptor subunit n=1 Tax=Denitratisoma sp. DHT3 TaxID=1981880 RepID=UPI001C95861D|nr:HlyD family type I secretion periplasmic adaptor subunit [Denitratisoma sp. DHT3]